MLWAVFSKSILSTSKVTNQLGAKIKIGTATKTPQRRSSLIWCGWTHKWVHSLRQQASKKDGTTFGHVQNMIRLKQVFSYCYLKTVHCPNRHDV